MFLYLNSLRNIRHSLRQLPPLTLSLSLALTLDRALTNSRPSRWPHSKYPTSLAGNRNVFVCAEILSVPLTQTQTRNIQQTLIYDNLVHLIIATEHTKAGQAVAQSGLSTRATHAGTHQPSCCVNELAILFCSLLLSSLLFSSTLSCSRCCLLRSCSLRLCVKHFHFHFPFKFNANLLAGQAALHFGS